MSVQSGSTPPHDKDLGSTNDASINRMKLDPSKFGIDLKDLTPETFDKIKAIIESANSLLTEDERKYNEEQKKKQIDSKKKFDDAIEAETRKEVFEIPKGSTKTWHFIGYDSDQFIELMKMGNQADFIKEKMELENTDTDTKGKLSDEYNQLVMDIYKKTIKYSLEGINDEIINKLPKRSLQWYWLVLKEKNDNPLPFEVNA